MSSLKVFLNHFANSYGFFSQIFFGDFFLLFLVYREKRDLLLHLSLSSVVAPLNQEQFPLCPQGAGVLPAGEEHESNSN